MIDWGPIEVPLPMPSRGATGKGLWEAEFLVGPDGKVADLWVLTEPTFDPPAPALNRELAARARAWRYEPLVVSGAPVPFCVTNTVQVQWR